MKKLFALFTVLLMGFIVIAITPVVYADNDNNCVKTSILGNGQEVCDDGKGNTIFTEILRPAIDIMTIGIGILGVIGISVVGIQYLTAGDNEEQTKKAKRRMLEIIIGLAIYALFYAALRWLLPNFDESVQKISYILPAQISYPTPILRA